MESILLTEKEAAKYIRMSVSYLQKDRMYGTLKNRVPGPSYIKLGRSVRYHKDDLETWLGKFRVQRVH